MCEITGKYTESEKFTGYKLVYIIDGRYYSPVTGVEYKVGEKVKAITSGEAIENFRENSTLNTLSLGNYWSKPYSIFSSFYTHSMQGKTGVFMDLTGAKSHQSNEAIVKMTISDNLVRGFTCDSPIIAGEFIESIALIDEK